MNRKTTFDVPYFCSFAQTHTYTWARSHFFLHQIRLLSVFLYSCRVLFTVAIYLSLSCCALARTRTRACVLIRSECSFRTKGHNARHRNASPLYLSNVRRCVLSECVQWRIALNVFLFEATFIVSTHTYNEQCCQCKIICTSRWAGGQVSQSRVLVIWSKK